MIGALDRKIFYFINRDLENPVFDHLMPFISQLNEGWSGPVSAVLLIAFLVWRAKRRAGWLILALALSVGAADLISYRLIKPAASRERPNFILEEAKLRVPAHRGFSFPSNHAANSFAGATLIALTLPPTAAFFLTYAALVSFSRVYVGVHYPFDTLAGALLGIMMGALVFTLFRRKLEVRP